MAAVTIKEIWDCKFAFLNDILDYAVDDLV